MGNSERGACLVACPSAGLTSFDRDKTSYDRGGGGRSIGASKGDMIHIPVVKREPWRTEHEQHRDSGMGLEADIPSMARGLRTVEVAEAVI